MRVLMYRLSCSKTNWVQMDSNHRPQPYQSRKKVASMITVNGYVQRSYTTIKHLIALSLSTIFEKSQYPTTGFVQVFTGNGLTMKNNHLLNM